MATPFLARGLSRRAFVSGGLKMSTGFVGGLLGAMSVGALGGRAQTPAALPTPTARPATPASTPSKLANVPASLDPRQPGWSIAYHDDKNDGGTPSVNLQAVGAMNSKALMRLVPSGRGNTVIGDRAEFTLMGTTLGTGSDWWADYKVRERLSDQVRFVHLLSDSSAGTEPVTRYVVEIDGTDHSSAVEHFTIVRDAWIDGAKDDQHVMLDIKGDTGITAVANTKIAVGGLKIGPAQAGEITVYLDDGAKRAALTRQAGAEGDLIVRNFGPGAVVLRPNDSGSGDLTVGRDGSVRVSGGIRISGSVQPMEGTVGIGNRTGIGNGSPSTLNAPAQGSGSGPAGFRVRAWIQATNGTESGWLPFFK